MGNKITIHYIHILASMLLISCIIIILFNPVNKAIRLGQARLGYKKIFRD